ncbi:hypothetical protein D3C85_1171710 [compost metagenome]
MVDHLIHGHGDEVHQHDFSDRAHAAQGRTDGSAHDRLLGDRRGTHALGTEAVGQPGGALENAAALRVGDILTEHHHRPIDFHCVVQGHGNGLGHIHALGFDGSHARFSSA